MGSYSCRATLLLKRHALTPFAVPAGLGATVRCVLLMRAQALALQVRNKSGSWHMMCRRSTLSPDGQQLDTSDVILAPEHFAQSKKCSAP
jgi:hypothetical protein